MSLVKEYGFSLIFNKELAVDNSLGRFGAVISHLFIYRWFGIISYLFVLNFFFQISSFFKISSLVSREELTSKIPI